MRGGKDVIIMKKTLRRFLCGATAAAVALGTGGVFADTDKAIAVTVDGAALKFDQPPIMENDRVLVPMRAIFEALGCTVNYNEYDNQSYVFASRGISTVYTEIGSDTLTVYSGTGDDKEVKLDVPSKIVADRTLVPIRAVSESLGALVNWNEKTNTVEIASKPTQHKIKGIKLSESFKDDSGKELVTFDATYPEIENPENDEFITNLNAEYKKYTEDRLAEVKTWIDDAKELNQISDASALLPLTYTQVYDVTRDNGDILSVTVFCSEYTGGAHPNSARISRTFDMKNKKELALGDVLNGTKEEIGKIVVDTFTKELSNDSANFDEEAVKMILPEIENEKDNVSFLMTDDGLVLYFSVYQVAAYAAGYPTVKIPYEGNAEMFKDGIIPQAAAIGIIGGADGATSIEIKE